MGLLGCGPSVSKARRAPPKPRVMALGDSITLGSPAYAPSESYRREATKHLISNGQKIRWVGPERHIDQTYWHLGVSGRFIHQIKTNFTTYGPKYRPHVVIVNGGTNDLFYPGNNADKNETAMRLLIDDVLAVEGVKRVLLTDLPTQPDKPTESADTSARYSDIADDYDEVEFAAIFAGVEMTDTVPAVEHPTNAGYEAAGVLLGPILLNTLQGL